MKDNTVGSLSLVQRLNMDPYILGLWGADGYLRTSSFGVTSIYPVLAKRFRDFLLHYFQHDRLRLRVYLPPNVSTFDKTILKQNISVCATKKAKHPAYQIYVNSRPFVRVFLYECKRKPFSAENVPAYFAGRFDGDGSIALGHKKDCRIVYTTHQEAAGDQKLLSNVDVSIKSSIYHYKDAHTFVLYIRKASTKQFVEKLRPFSNKLQHRLIAP